MAAPGQQFVLRDDQQILQQPRLTHLVEGVCTVGGFTLIHGPSNVGKTFIVLGLAFAVTSGRPWHGRQVTKGTVVYVAAEGHTGLINRVHAWKRAHGMEGETIGMRFVCQPVNPLDRGQMAALQQQLLALTPPPILIVVDTWSACLSEGGGDEDSAKDAGRAAGAWRTLGTACGAAVMVVHHEGHKSRGRARGSSALRATSDTEIAVSAKGKVITLTNTKQRDIEPFTPIRLQLETVQLDNGQTSCVLVGSAGTCPAPAPDELAAKATEALGSLAREGATFSKWHKASGQAESTFIRSVKDLVAAGRVVKDGDGQGARYSVAHHLHNRQTTSTDTSEGDPKPPPPAVTPLRGDSSGGEGHGIPPDLLAGTATSIHLDFTDVMTETTMPAGPHEGEPIDNLPTSYLRHVLDGKSSRMRLFHDVIAAELEYRAANIGTGD